MWWILGAVWLFNLAMYRPTSRCKPFEPKESFERRYAREPIIKEPKINIDRESEFDKICDKICKKCGIEFLPYYERLSARTQIREHLWKYITEEK